MCSVNLSWKVICNTSHSRSWRLGRPFWTFHIQFRLENKKCLKILLSIYLNVSIWFEIYCLHTLACTWTAVFKRWHPFPSKWKNKLDKFLLMLTFNRNLDMQQRNTHTKTARKFWAEFTLILLNIQRRRNKTDYITDIIHVHVPFENEI